MINQTPKLIPPVGHAQNIESVAFSPNNDFVLTGSFDHSAKLWNLQGNEIYSFEGHINGVTGVSFSPDSLQIVTSSYDKDIVVWDVETGKEVHRLQQGDGAEEITSMALSSDGKRILIGGNKGRLSIFTIPPKNKSAKEEVLEGHTDRVNAVAFSPNNKFIVSASSDEKAFKIDLKSKEKRILDHSVKNTDPDSQEQKPENRVRGIAISHDNSQIVTGGDDGMIRIWNTEDDDPVLTFEGHTNTIHAIAINENDLIVSGSTDKTAVVWERNKNKDTYVKKFTLEVHERTVGCVAFSKDGNRILTGSDDSSAILWDTLTGSKIASFKGHSTSILDAAVAPDGLEVVVGHTDSYAFIWDFQEGEIRNKTLTKNEKELSGKDLRAVAYSKDGEHIITGCEDKSLILWSTKNKKKLAIPLNPETTVKAVAISDDSKFAVCGTTSKNENLYIWDLNSKEEPVLLMGPEIEIEEEDKKKKIRRHNGEVRAVAISPDSKYILSGSVDDHVILWNRETGAIVKELKEHNATIWSVEFSPDGALFLSGGADNKARLWDSKTQKELHVLDDHTDHIYDVTFSSDGTKILTGSKDGTAKLWDLEGKLLKTFKGHKSTVSCVQFLPLGAYVLTGSHDRTLKIWNSETEEEIATLMHVGLEDWVVTTPGGLFDASQGAMKLMHYVVGLDVIQLDQLKERYWQPGLLKTLFHLSNDILKDVEEFSNVPLYPKVIDIKIDGSSLKVEIEKRIGGIGRVSLRINGKERDSNINKRKRTKFSVALKKYEKYYKPGFNTVAIRCWNEEGWLPGPYHERNYYYKKGRKRSIEEVTLHTLFIGTSEYRNSNLSLSFPDKDANYLNKAITAVGKELFKKGGVQNKILTTEDSSSEDFSSKENIKLAFKELAEKAKPDDVVIIYFSGHGANYDDGKKAQYYYLTHEIMSSNLNDSAIRLKGTISSEELTQWINVIPAQKQVLIFDTCYSGKIVESLKSRSAIDATRDKAMERMKDRTGMYVLTGSAADKVSYEASNYGQGLLTYSLLLGMRGAALYQRPNQQLESVDILTLFNYSKDEVERLSREFSVIQRPLLRAPNNIESFDIGIASKKIKEEIRVAIPKPVFMQSTFMNVDGYLDDLDISVSLDQYLAGSIGIGNRPQAIFINVNNFPGAHHVRGLYEKKDEKYHLTGRVYKKEKPLGDINVIGEKMEDMVPLIARRVEELAFPIDTYEVPTDEEVGIEEKGRKQDLEALKGQPQFGYKDDFIGDNFKVALPKLSRVQKRDIAKSNDDEEILNYQYFSVIQSKSRKLPFYAACNLHGGKFRQLGRSGSFIRDPRLAREHHWDDDFYTYEFKDKDGQEMKFTKFFHRGHMTKREDTQWGDTDEVAVRGAKLTFFFTNAIPQHGHLNSVVWRGLEDYIMDVATHDKKAKDNEGFKINIMTGPVFQDDDPVLTIKVKKKKGGEEVEETKDVPIPVLFWKIVYFKKESEDKLYYIGFMMGQKTLLEEAFGHFGIKARDADEEVEEKEAPFLNYKDKDVYQVKVSVIEKMTKMKFHKAIDPLKGQEGGQQISEVIKKKGISDDPDALPYELAGLTI